jgi:hypothetical protein
MADLQLLPQSWISRDFNVTQNGALVAKIGKASLWKDKAVIEIDGASFDVYREHQMSGDFLLQQDGRSIARAQNPSVLRNSFLIDYGGKEFALKKVSVWRRDFALFDQDRKVGFVAPAGIFTRKANISLPDELPLQVRVFVVWLVQIMWRREQSAAAASASVR